MLSILNRIEQLLPALLAQPDRWKSVLVDYHPPVVERLWTAVTVDDVEYRVYLHRILPCSVEDALVHTHPWPSAMRVLSGRYTMTVGHGEGTEAPPVTMTLSLPAGTTYEMAHPDGWHAVCPEGDAAYSLMVTGKPWARESPKSPYPLEPLDTDAQNTIMAFFRQQYGEPSQQG